MQLAAFEDYSGRSERHARYRLFEIFRLSLLRIASFKIAKLTMALFLILKSGIWFPPATELQNKPLGAKLIMNRSEEHTSELQSLMRISYAVFCLKKKNKTIS